MWYAVAAGLLACLATGAAACNAPRAAVVGEVAVAGGSALVTRAWYADPTTDYDHAIFGRATTAQVLRAEVAGADGCLILTAAAGDGHVFEDTAPRIVDLDGDGRAEVIAVRTSLTQGAQLALYGVRGDALAVLATTPYIGQARRWLAPVGGGDIDGDGRIEVAYIDRPHLDRVMRVWRFDGAALTEVYRIPGLTNHRIGDPVISGGFRTCGGVTETVTADAGWTRVMATRIVGGRAVMRDLGPMGQGAFAAALRCGG
ncbi:FG-GAP-like repeat-containing protein [Loktanella sp. M215]|uniref:FG-GAP-like repeat-containing protein n=1 Tax=Loktanella sp. M215 TaxID=2675431 RepID=UPI001F32D044|nr:FG-GAP-like repeat-containing protein [Loktanella sp. M215]MCF7697907.1 VCBS repeat-containing protein [Loktanella sp. M215]